ncbi:uncharacterized protein LOC143459149 [Clavelina lepadiformis]|uniref:G-protein coupled receptors family 1 profile domain-containing protein n=1 Tax=Clavelina lepadiformis TaxID=159417 RepID=A0ABP0GZM2_CLALP
MTTMLSFIFLLVNLLKICSTQDVIADKVVNKTAFEIDFFDELATATAQKASACNELVKQFTLQWYQRSLTFTTYLETLQKWNCPQFKEVCQNRTFAFTDFTSKAYSYFCNKTYFKLECFDVIGNETLKHYFTDQQLQTEMNKSMLGNSTATLLRPFELTPSQILEPCIQLLLYEKSQPRRNMLELLLLNLPFCEFIWCGFDEETVKNKTITPWQCVPLRCIINIILESAVCIILAVGVIFANSTVLAVYCTKPKLRNSQAIFKIFLAVADLLVGVVVLPTFVSTLYGLVFRRTFVKSSFNQMDFVVVNGTQNFTKPSSIFLEVPLSPLLTRTYINTVDFFSVTSVAASAYSLIAAAIDRFLALHRPLVYFPHVAKKLAIQLCVSVWILALIFAILPMVVPTLKYGLVASILISSVGPASLIMYAVALLIPLIALWILTLATYEALRRHARKQNRFTVKSDRDIAVCLAKTLLIMVLAFTFSLVPSIILVVVSHFLPSINFNNPDKLNENAAVAYNSAEFVSVLILVCNSLWNGFIYSIRSEEFRKAAREIYRSITGKLPFVCRATSP